VAQTAAAAAGDQHFKREKVERERVDSEGWTEESRRQGGMGRWGEYVDLLNCQRFEDITVCGDESLGPKKKGRNGLHK
jgi:hypothetical protein